MIYLIGQLWVWLLLTAVSAAVAGWAFAAERAAPAQRALRRDRENLLSDLIRLTGEDGGSPSGAVENERESDATRRLLAIRDGRIAELERALETARARTDDLSGELAELRRRGPGDDTEQASELRRLRGLVADTESERARTIDVEAEADPNAEENAALQLWRLRYFEQRVRYLETQSRAQSVADLAAADPLPDWRVRDAEARATYLEDALRATQAPADPAEAAPGPAVSPFAADAEVDVLLRWRLLYLERRVAHLQATASHAPVAPMPVLDAAPDFDRWKWRARYLESRVRHLEQRPPVIAEAPRAVMADAEDAPPPAPPTRRGVKPPVLGSARNGAPDDFTLIEGVSLQQQSTLYSLGVFHFDQIAAWTPDHVAWVDNYLRLRGRIADQEWIDQADEIAREGPAAARRVSEDETL
jgi:predicted flap endonuclease-1-like 5' DNA nuclease